MNAAVLETVRADLIAAAQQASDPAAPIDKRRALTLARNLLAPDRPNAPDYPADALGPLADTCKAIAEHGQLRPAMAGQSLLGAASLLTQGLFNVETLGGHKPLSLYLLTLGESGDGKSTAEDAALAPVWDWQRHANADYERALGVWAAEGSVAC